MLSILISLFVLPVAQAEERPQQVIASCECIVLNDAGVPIRPPHSFVGAPIPVVPEYFEVHGEGSLKSEYEQKNCLENETGELSMACAIAAVKAEYNASYLCGQIAQKYHPDRMDGFQNGMIEQGSCYLSLD